ncbi:MAG: hypothetical protein ACYC8W_02905 [Candidatus Tyrphobacter sp.]
MHGVLSGYPLFAALIVVAQSFFGSLPIDGISCDSAEGAVEHVHVHLQLFERGRAVEIPAGIGIPVDRGCLYWLHTHAPDGIIHIESPVRRTFTLGAFFDVWGMDLNARHAGPLAAVRGRELRVTVNGVRWNGDSRAIPLRDHEEIVIQAGPPFARPRPAAWSNL